MSAPDKAGTIETWLSPDRFAAGDAPRRVDGQGRKDDAEPSGSAPENRHVTVLVAAAAKADGFCAAQVADAVAAGVRATLPSAHVLQVPDLDSGSCFVGQVVGLSNGWIERIGLTGPHGELALGQLGLMISGSELTAVIAADETVESGRNSSRSQDPTSASSRAIGQLIMAALDRGAARIIVGCGSSGAYDGGIGMAEALGIRFFDAGRAEIVEAGGLLRLSAIDMSHRDPRLDGVSIQAVVDPGEELLGPSGIARTRGAGHGASTSQALRHERGLARFAKIVHERLGIDVAALHGAGAAGGLAAGLMAFAGASLISRSEFLDRCEALEAGLASAAMVITADAAVAPADASAGAAVAAGPANRATASGDACAWLARKAAASSVPIIALSLQRLLDAGHLDGRDDGGALAMPANAAGPQWPVRSLGARLHAASAVALRRALGSWHRPAESL